MGDEKRDFTERRDKRLLQQVYDVFGRRPEPGELPLELLPPSARLVPDAPLNADERAVISRADCRFCGENAARMSPANGPAGHFVCFEPADGFRPEVPQPHCALLSRRPGPAIPGGKRQDAEEDDIREAVFRHQFSQHQTGASAPRPLFFLSVERGDPPDGFIARFRCPAQRVRKVSQSASSPGEGVHDRETGEPGLILRVERIAWNGADAAEVEGGHYTDGLNASGNVYSVRREDGYWTVTEEGNLWIS